jgi:protein-L-isoaspartate(D-aspartate) O-methyltransferase
MDRGVLLGAAAWIAGAMLCGCSRNPQEGAQPRTAAPQEILREESSSAAPSASAETPGTAPAERAAAFGERADEREELARVLSEEGIVDSSVLEAMRRVPRHAFVLPWLHAMAYANRALPIVGGQTISQPYIVAFMTEAVKPTKRSTCLEIGTGSGYQAAVLAELCMRTYSIEYLPEVASFGAKNLRDLGYGPDRVVLRVGDGYVGWPEAAPFDAIVVTAAPEHVPEPLLDQLAVGGRLVIPVGGVDEVQQLERWTRLRAGKDAAAFRRESLLPVRFVPFAGTRVAK